MPCMTCSINMADVLHYIQLLHTIVMVKLHEQWLISRENKQELIKTKLQQTQSATVTTLLVD